MSVQMPEALGSVPSALSPYRVLDLTEGGSSLGPRMLGDMGADVIRVEPPGGSPTRRTPPFLGGDEHTKSSVLWAGLNFNKRGITLDVANSEGNALLKRLIETADFLFESFEPGYLDALGLGYDGLKTISPGLVMVSITPFGQTGPYAHYKGPDIVPWAMGGYMWMCGDPDRAPVRPSVPEQAYFHASAMAAGASLIGLLGRASTGQGTYIDQSAQACGPWMLTHTYQYFEFEEYVLKREGAWRHYGPTKTGTVFTCKDGFVVSMQSGGQIGGASLNRLVSWMAEDEMAPEWMQAIDWPTYDARKADQALTYRIAGAVTAFFETKTKGELLRGAVERSIHMAPVNTLADLMEDRQLFARDYWTDVDHREIERVVTYPGAPYLMSETPWRVHRPPPRVGQHNGQVLGEELGLSVGELDSLRKRGAI